MRLEVNARARRLIEMLPQRTIYGALELALLALLAVQVARLIWSVVTPVGPLGNWRANSSVSATASADVLRSFDPFFRLDATAPSAPTAATVTPLSLTLFGIRLDGATSRGSAIIATPDGVQASFSVGAEIMPGVTLKSVSFDHVTLTRGGVDEDLFIDQSGGASASSAATMDSNGVLSAPPSAATGGQPVTLARLRAEIGFIPRVDSGKVTGLTVRPQGSGTIFRQVGLKEGDVVTQLGGRAISGAGDIDLLAGQFAKGGALSITVERGAEVLPLTITLAGQ
ncbi:MULTISPECIES: type II secretion system protein N [unclassified Sphingomonas]|uniref:type II secretion system protein N n=1 Tax=unclassified Sphingomonas TaxID=196159 RepID=UPI000BC408B5|nr:MAG: type II secretory protein PulC [Sphingomonas sp. 12-62-6]OYX39081.1 MAG: type II secretory protein PulC [Sphingomonas sp. 32-62-10]